jgi:flagellin
MPVISTNIAANSAVRHLNTNSADQAASLSKLASGSRIAQASDDAAGLAISTRISSDVTTLTQAATNASHGISILQTADGGASNISDILQRMKALASQSASGTVTNAERTYIQAEFSQLIEEVDGIATGTRYNGESLLDGSSTQYNNNDGVKIMVGSSGTDTITLKIDSLDAATLKLKGEVAATTPSTITSSAFQPIELAADETFEVNGVEVTLTAAGGAAGDGVWSADAIAGAITQALVADGSTNVTVKAVDGKLVFENAESGSAEKIEINTFSAGLSAEKLGLSTTATYGTDIINGASLDVTTQDGATAAITAIDAAINTVSNARANIGALESRFAFRGDSIATSIENLSAANSAIKDVDVAAESAMLASAKVKTQAAVAAAAQASQMPESLLKLLN